MGDFTPSQLDTLRHMLGINDPYKAKPEPYRNYYCASPGNERLHALAAAGAVELYSTRDNHEWFRCTDAGRTAAMASFRTIQASKPKRVYSRFLSLSDAIPDLTFREFITNPKYREYRNT